jgi:cytochrome c-type biogenesis protein CcmE
MDNAPAARPRKVAWAPIVVTGAILAIGLAVVGTSTAGGGGMYSYTLADLSKARDKVDGREVKVTGKVKAGSVRGEPGSGSFRFDIEDAQGHSLTVAYPKLLPDPFQEGREAIVQGRLQKGELQAANLTVKCPSRYGDSQTMTTEQLNDAYAKHKANTSP